SFCSTTPSCKGARVWPRTRRKFRNAAMPSSSPSKFSAPTRAAISVFCGEGGLPRHRDLEREFVDHFVTALGDDKSVAEKNAEHAIGGDRIGFGHDDHARLEHLLEFFPRDMFSDDVRLISDKIDAVHLGRPRLITLVAEKFAGLAHRLDRLARRDLGDDAAIARQRDLVPELAHHFGRLAEADRRADLRGVAAIAGGELNIDDVAWL